MLVRTMTITDRRNFSPIEITCDPNWENISQGIESLDGDQRSTLALDISNNEYMGIGGGPTLYVCDVLAINGSFSLINPDVPDDDNSVIELVVGDLGEFYIWECVPLEYVLQVARHYAETGMVDETLPWQKD